MCAGTLALVICVQSVTTHYQKSLKWMITGWQAHPLSGVDPTLPVPLYVLEMTCPMTIHNVQSLNGKLCCFLFLHMANLHFEEQVTHHILVALNQPTGGHLSTKRARVLIAVGVIQESTLQPKW